MSLTEQLREYASKQSLLDGDPDHAPTEEELAVAVVAPTGERPLLEKGVIYSADWRKFGDGMARHARAQVSALAQAGVPVVLQSISSEGMFLDSEVRPEVRAEVGHLASMTVGSALLAVRQAVFHNADFVRNLVVPAGGRLGSIEDENRVFESTVLYTSIERDSVADVLIEVFERCAEIWVPCKQNADALISSGMPSDKVVVVPFPYDPTVGVSRIPAPRGTERAPDGKRFYSIGKWEPRKEHARILLAFLCAFTPKDKASLLLKVHGWGEWEGYPSVEQALVQAAEDPRVRGNGWNGSNVRKRVRVITDKVSDEEIVRFHAENNIYVSASHGEAWDIPAFEAKCAGNRLVHVGFGGSSDYADADDIKIPFTLEQVHSAYGWEASRWAEYKFEDLVEAMRAATPPKRRSHPASFNGKYSYHAVGELMKARLSRLVGALPQESFA